MPVWDRFLTEQDKEVFKASGYGTFLGIGKRPALIVIDVTYAFSGEKNEPLLESIAKWHFSCGPYAWDAVPHIQTLLRVFREKNYPIFYSNMPDGRGDGFGKGLWRSSRIEETDSIEGFDPQAILAEIAPEPRDVVITKASPSVFFGTPLMSHLTSLGVDSIILCGTTTSGCVRATAVDGFANNLRVAVAEEATFDRGEASHAIALFDLNAKYADVMSVDEICQAIKGMPDDLYEGMIARWYPQPQNTGIQAVPGPGPAVSSEKRLP